MKQTIFQLVHFCVPTWKYTLDLGEVMSQSGQQSYLCIPITKG